jgi:hypothetical protein
MAAAGLWTTATDLANWMIAIADAHAGRSTTLLSQNMARQMLTAQKEREGLGLLVYGSGNDMSFGHTGSNVGFKSYIRMFPARGAGIVILTNGDNGPVLSDEIIRAVAAEYRWPDLGPQRITPVALSAGAAADIVGNYVLRVGPGRPVEVRLEGGRLTLHGMMNVVQELVPESDVRFVSPVTAWRFEFARDTSGRSTGIRIFRDATAPPIVGTRAP